VTIVIAAAVSAAITAATYGVQKLVEALRHRRRPGPPTTSQQVSSGADGSPIPILVGGTARWAGQIGWSSGITFVEQAQAPGKSGPIGFVYFASFAVLWGEGPLTIRRIWGDTNLLWIAPGVSPNLREAGAYSAWNPAADYLPGDIVMHLVIPPGTAPHDPSESIWECVYPNTNKEPSLSGLYWVLASEYPPWNRATNYAPGAIVGFFTQVYACINPNQGNTPDNHPNEWMPLAQYYGTPANYPGDDNQLPDPLMESLLGAGNVTAYRGICYSVFTRLPLASFGNRIPNMRVEANRQTSGFLSIAPGGGGGMWNPQNNAIVDVSGLTGGSYSAHVHGPGGAINDWHDDITNTDITAFDLAGLSAGVTYYIGWNGTAGEAFTAPPNPLPVGMIPVAIATMPPGQPILTGSYPAYSSAKYYPANSAVSSGGAVWTNPQPSRNQDPATHPGVWVLLS
jgi:hypothetical protein